MSLIIEREESNTHNQDVSSVQNMSGLFENCVSLTEFPDLNISPSMTIFDDPVMKMFDRSVNPSDGEISFDAITNELKVYSKSTEEWITTSLEPTPDGYINAKVLSREKNPIIAMRDNNTPMTEFDESEI